MVFSCLSERTMKHLYIVSNVLLVMAFHTASPFVECPKFCEEGWFGFHATSSCYRFIGYPKEDYQTANQQCRALRSTATLASITSSLENEFLTHMWIFMGNGEDWDDVWIGYNNMDRSGSWTWTDDSQSSYTRWSPGRPNGGMSELCGEIWNEQKFQGNWNDDDCNKRQAYLCMYTP